MVRVDTSRIVYPENYENEIVKRKKCWLTKKFFLWRSMKTYI